LTIISIFDQKFQNFKILRQKFRAIWQTVLNSSIRFPELAMRYRREGADILVYPGAFNMTTGPAHWEKLQVSRALDNQVTFPEFENFRFFEIFEIFAEFLKDKFPKSLIVDGRQKT